MIANGDAFEDDRMGSNPDIVTNANGCRIQFLVLDRDVREGSVIMVGYVGKWPDHDIVSDLNSFRGIEKRVAVDIATRPYQDLGGCGG